MKMMGRTSLLAALALCALPVLTPAGEAPAAGAASQDDTEKKLAAAQQRLDAAVREVAELSGQMGRRFNMRIGVDPGGMPPPRALLGVAIVQRGEKDGAHVGNVSPGGAAAEAGIKEGDIITSIGGDDLTRDSNPGNALVEKMRQQDPDKKVAVTVLRDGKKLNLEVTPRSPPPMTFDARRFPGGPGGPGGFGMAGGPGGPGGPGGLAPGVRRFALERGPGIPGGPGMAGPMLQRQQIELRRFDELGTRFRGMEFATLSEQLGSYFGVKTGVLVVRAGANSPFKLKDGDVILAIDGREATSAQHAGRILRSYRAGEKLTLKVQRDRKAQSIEVTAPGGRDED